MRTRRSIEARILLAFLLVIFAIPTSVAEDDVVCFTAMVPEEPVTDVIYHGEQYLGLTYVFGHNCSNWSIEVSSLLFGHSLGGLNREDVEAGKSIVSSIAVNPDASFGAYDVTVYFNYTNEENENISRSYDFTLHLVRSIVVRSVLLPEGNDHTLAVTFEAFQKFDNVTVLFHGNGDVGVTDEEIYLENVGIGKTTVSTTVYQLPDAFSSQKVGYHIIARLDNHIIEVTEHNTELNIDWDGSGGDPFSVINRTQQIIIISTMAVTLVAFNYYIFFHKKRK